MMRDDLIAAGLWADDDPRDPETDSGAALDVLERLSKGAWRGVRYHWVLYSPQFSGDQDYRCEITSEGVAQMWFPEQGAFAVTASRAIMAAVEALMLAAPEDAA